ncbi:TonB-dependent receptor [Marinimicrobium agarilyticum]|uniref:TonB-dependent receptor n=1 Tax=Marinimicrobium agarilyticum TaxID=306546 RepID=UPI0003F915AF|nr:TonB-dependent receptor [Marinimicrobium agarilyticum]
MSTARAVHRLVLCLGVLCSLAPFVARAERFDIPAQPLADALSAFSRVTERPVIFKPDAVRGTRSTALQGELSLEEALNQLLADTRLTAQATGDGWLILPQPAPATAKPEATPTLNELLVVGRYSDALGRALQQERQASRHQDIILAERIGEFPALNVAEAIKRSPGVSVVRDRGEALFISIRGLPTQFNTLTLNGAPIASNENTRTSEQYGRRFHYDTLPAELIAGLTVRKSPQASDTEGAIGGSVNLETFQPLALDAPALNVTTAISHSELADRQDPRASLIGSWHNAEQTLGVLLGASYSERHLRQDRALNFRWYSLTPETTDAEAPPANSLSPGSVRPTLELEHRRRLGLNAAVQWRLGEHTEIDLNSFALGQRIGYREYSYSADYDPTQLDLASIEWRRQALVAGRTETGSSQIGTESTELTDRFEAHSLALRHTGGPWRWQARLTQSDTRSYNSEPIRRTRLRREDDVSFAFRYFENDANRLPSIDSLDDTLDTPTRFPGRRLEWREIDSEDSYSSVGLSALRQFENRAVTQWETGLQWRERRRDYQRRDALITEGIDGRYFPLGHFQPLPVDDFLTRDAGRLPRQWWVPDESAFWAAVDTQALAKRPPSAEDKQNSYQVQEAVSALYSQLHWEQAPWRGDIGLRYALTRQRTFGYRGRGDSEPPDPVSAQSRYGHWLPALNMAYQVSTNHQWRFALARTMNRPDLQDLAPRLTLNSGDEHTAVGGNPLLAPTLAWQTNLAWEWYFAPKSLFSAGAFWTDLDDFIQNDILNIELDGTPYELTTKSNGARARVQGLEFDFQHMLPLPSPLSGELGLQANVTLTDSRAHYRLDGQSVTDDLADVSGRTINLGLVYETRRFGVRAHYNWRDRVLKNVGTATLASHDSNAFGTLDAQFAYHLSDGVSMTLEGINLTNAAEWESVAGSEFAGYTYYGRTFLLGMKAYLQ